MRRRQILAGAAKKSPPPTIDELYEQKFGKKPHHRMKRETIKRKLADDNTG